MANVLDTALQKLCLKMLWKDRRSEPSSVPRVFVKRFCRLTLCFSKKLENLEAAVAMHIANYNFTWRCRLPGNTGKHRPPAATLAGVTDRFWTFDDLFVAAM